MLRSLIALAGSYLLASLLLADVSRGAEIRVIQLDRFDEQHNGSIDVDIGTGHNVRQDGPIECNLLLEGPIEPGDLDRLRQVVDARPGNVNDTMRLCLHSPGGSYDEGLSIARYLMEHSIGTAVAAGAECYSACAIIFMGGTFPWKGELNRYLHTQAVLGFHAPYIPDRNDKNKMMVDESVVGRAFSEGIKAMHSFMQLGVGNPVKRIVPELMQEMMAQGPSEFYFIDTVGKAIRLRIHLYGVDQLPSVTPPSICNSCVNVHYGAYERYGRGGDVDLCADPPTTRRTNFSKGIRYTNDIAPRGGECEVDVMMQSGKVASWTFSNGTGTEFGDGLELAYWYLLSPSTKLASLSHPGRSENASDGQSSQSDSERLLRDVRTFVIMEYLGHGRISHRDRPDLFAPQVRYYKKGLVTREAVLADKVAYYRRWPQRRYEVIEDSLGVSVGNTHLINVSFRYTFEVSNGKATRRGTGVTRLEVARADGKFSIASEDGEAERQ